ncbi:MAG: ring-cleaving dioxygenase [Candidatus Methylacidiphilales bacterium]|nr:ring-cleaving dioxygenase [Candidatus Methylacidiphilales bacterium]
MKIHGLHHVTAIAGDAQRNLDFYTGVLGLRLVKNTVNFDDPGSYHFYFGDALGTPGSILTFFAWPGAKRGVRGSGEVEATAYAIPEHSVSYWLERLKRYRVHADTVSSRFGQQVLRFSDPDGMVIELVASRQPHETGHQDYQSAIAGIPPWSDNPVPAEHEIRSFYGVTANIAQPEMTSLVLTEVLGYTLVGQEGDRTRYVAPGTDGLPGHPFDVLATPKLARGRQSAGTVHHVAMRVKDDAEQVAWLEKLQALGFRTSPVMDRVYFHSIYFREPGGILFELATNPPGFTHDEKLEDLGTSLRLPANLERSRSQIEQYLPKLTLPGRQVLVGQ